jgi:ABC-2 type transport system permease protein
VRSIKGIIIGVITLLGAFVTSLVCVWLEGSKRASVDAGSNEAFTEFKRNSIQQLTGDAGLASYIASIPNSLLIFLQITIWLGPLLIALLGFDLMSSELQHRSVRFWTVRTRRWSYYTGKTLGLWATVALITLVLNTIAGTVAAIRGYVTVGQLATWGVRFWLTAVLIAGTWAAIAAFISSLFRQPLLSLLTTFLTFFVMWLVSLVGLVTRIKDLSESGVMKDMSWYEYLYPNSYDTLLLAHENTKVFTALGILVGFVVLANAAGAALFQRRDI